MPTPATIVVSGVSAGFGARVLFTGLDLVVAPGDIVGVVGPNGAGKSTLMRMLAGLIVPDEGRIDRTPRGATIGYVAQETERRPDETVMAFVERRTGVSAAAADLEAAGVDLATGTATAEDRYAAAWDRWISLGGADLDDRLPAVLHQLGLPDDMTTRPMTSLSGGQAARVGLAALVASSFDVYLLDEPTNDLDLPALDRLEEFVADLDAPVVVVSHDREFLARTVTTVVEIDRSLQRVVVYGGSYDSFLAERTTARQQARDAYDSYSARREELRARARTQRAWMDKGVKNARRKAKDNDKVGRGAKVEATEKQAAKARQTDRLIERLEVVEEPRKEWNLRFSIAQTTRSGDVVAVLRGATVTRGAFTLGPVDLTVAAGDRIILTGPNGAGKTTLLDVLLGRLAPNAGSATLGAGVVVGEIDQARQVLDGATTVAAACGIVLPEATDADVRTLLAKFGLSAAHVDRPLSSLSPGERTRASMALLQAKGVNVVALDEPTNHLDLPAIEQLEAALEAFSGTMIVVTHDRRTIATLRATRRWHLEAGRLSESLS